LAAATAQAKTITPQDAQLRVWNSGANPLYFCIYQSVTGTTRVASATDASVPPGTIRTATKADGFDTVSLFSPLGTTCEIETTSAGM
jgi:hypothetical protein